MSDWEIILIVASIWVAGGLWFWTILKAAGDADRRMEEMRAEEERKRIQGDDEARDWVGLTD